MASYIGASAEQEDPDPILMAFAAEAAKGDRIDYRDTC